MAGEGQARQRVGCGRPYRGEVVGRARELMEGTSLPVKAIVAALGIGRTTLFRWWKRQGWRRPPRPAPRSGPESGLAWRAAPARSRRQRGRPIYADGVHEVHVLVTRSLLSQQEIARRTGVSQERISAWARARGWTRPVPARATRFAAARRVGLVATEGDRRGRPYAASVRAAARTLWEETRLSTALIGARLGVHRVTVARWAKEEAWVRPRGRKGARQLRGFFGTQRAATSGPPRIGRL